jgi:ABC-type multidrug transport system fused ATPase/permease subunit
MLKSKLVVKKRKRNRKLPKPKITLDQLGQVIFTVKEVSKIIFRIQPKLLTVTFLLNAVWGFLAVPGFYLEKLIIDELIDSVGAVDHRPIFYSVGFLVLLAILLSLVRNFIGSFNRYLRRVLSQYFQEELTIIIGKKLAELDMGTIENPEFRDKYNKIETESGRRAWGLMMPMSDIPNYLVGFISAVLVLIFVHPLISLAIILISLPGIFINSRYIKKGYELSAELSPLRRIRGWLYYYLVKNRNFMELKLLQLSDSLTSKLRNVTGEIIEKKMKYRKRRELSGVLGFIDNCWFISVIFKIAPLCRTKLIRPSCIAFRNL